MVKVTKAEFVAMLKEQRGATPATIQWRRVLKDRELKAPKRNGTSGTIAKSGRTQVMLNCVYGNSVNYQRKREDKVEDFTPNPRKWGQRIPKTTLVEHKGKVYLETHILKPLDTQWWQNGAAVEQADIAHLLAKKSQKSRQEVEKEVILRDFDIDNLEYVNTMGEQYVLV